MPNSKVVNHVNGKADDFYKDILIRLNKIGVPYLIGGTFALNAYTGMDRKTKDLDIFTKASDYPKIMNAFIEQGFRADMVDERWLAKIKKGSFFIDIIFAGGNAVLQITDEWLNEGTNGKIYGVDVRLTSPTEYIWSKLLIAERGRYEGPDIAHMILKKGKDIDWKKLLAYADPYWEILLVHLLSFRFIYPSEREVVPRWLLEELISRLNEQMNLPTSKTKVCRGRLLSRGDYAIDIEKWGFADIIGPEGKYQNQNEKTKKK